MRVAATAAALVLFACTQSPPTTTDRFLALGTMVDVTVRGGPDHGASLRAVRAVFDAAQQDWYAWNPDGARDPNAHDLLERARGIARASGGLFDPDIGALVELWGFHEGERPPGAPPAPGAIAAWRDLPVVVDLGAIGKGAAVAAALETLRAHGIEHALVNAGGDIAVIGDAGGRPWRIGIRDPRGPGVIAGVELAPGEAVFTSGDYERWFEWDDVRYHHILDPRTGSPVRGTRSITVIHDDPVLADAAATALFVAGDDWPTVAAALGLDNVMRIRADGGAEVTAAMGQRIRFERELDVATR